MDAMAGLRRRSRREWIVSVLVWTGLLSFVLLVYAVVVLGGGVLQGRSSSSPDVALSVVATTVVALTFDRVSSWLGTVVSRAVHGGRPSPFDVLRQFSGTSAGGHAAEELPERMARVLAEGTGALWVQVWLVLDGKSRLAAMWPPSARLDLVQDPTDTSTRGRRSHAVRHEGELLGLLVLQERDQVPLTSVEERLVVGLAQQSRLVLHGARLRAKLVERATELSIRADELRSSRRRLIEAQDNERRALERDVHDGAQQHLVALAVNLRLAHTLAESSPESADRLLAAQEHAAAAAVETVVQLARGIYPPLLAESGLVAALRAAGTNSPLPLELTAEGVGRYPPTVEAAAYFCCLEALQNAAKHSGATHIAVRLHGGSQALRFEVEDDGAGFDAEAIPDGSGLANMRDRLVAVDGVLTITSSATGTCIDGRIPIPAGAA